jgi:NADH:ubiquinone oxidoreductase subunit 6 (subunit J)
MYRIFDTKNVVYSTFLLGFIGIYVAAWYLEVWFECLCVTLDNRKIF